jgi:DNA-nicking Smr family endonuclease
MNRRPWFKLSEGDLELFNKVVADVKPLRSYGKSVINQKNRINKIDNLRGTNVISREIYPTKRATKISNAPIVIGDYSPGRAPGIDRKTSLKLKKGKVEIDYRLDLHGLSQIDARQTLEEAISMAWKNKLRLLLVITGKGNHRLNSDGHSVDVEKGVLRRVVPKWLKELPLSNFILALSSAQQIHGGTGALYVLLKRQIDNRGKG